MSFVIFFSLSPANFDIMAFLCMSLSLSLTLLLLPISRKSWLQCECNQTEEIFFNFTGMFYYSYQQQYVCLMRMSSFFFFFSKIIFVKLIGKEISWNSGSSSRLYRMSAELVHTEVLDTNIFKLHIFLLYLLTWLCFVMYHLKRNFPPPEILHSCKHFNWNFWFLPSFFFFSFSEL